LFFTLLAMWNVFRRELSSYFASPIASVFLVVFLTLALWFFYFFNNYFSRGQADMRDEFRATLPVLLTFFAPAIAMRAWAEERRQGTEELLLTLPIGELRVLLGKYLAAAAFIVVALALTFPMPLTLALTVDPEIGLDWGPILTGYLGVTLLGCAYLAIGCFISALTRHQIVAFVATAVVLMALTLPKLVAPVLPDLGPDAQKWIGLLSLSSHMDDMLKGVIDFTDVVFFLSVIGFALFLNYEALLARKWR
jgi:ABC-2 type transport system permease protein